MNDSIDDKSILDAHLITDDVRLIVLRSKVKLSNSAMDKIRAQLEGVHKQLGKPVVLIDAGFEIQSFTDEQLQGLGLQLIG